MRIIGVEVAPEHGFGRALLEGMSDYATHKCDARLQSVSQASPFPADRHVQLNGLILRLLDEKTYARARSRGIPVVDIYGEKIRNGVAQVFGDYRQIAQLAANLFLSRGYENIGWCGIGGLFFSAETKRHFIDFIRKSGRAVNAYDSSSRHTDVIVCNAPDHIPDAKEMRQWIRSLPKPCAIFCCNDHRAFQIMRIASECGFSIPEEVSILGVDNDSTICAFADVPLSSIDPDAFRIGQTAARVLDAMIEKRPDDKPHKPILIPPKCLIERQSTMHFPVSPAWLSKVLVAIERNLSDGINATEAVALSGHSAPAVERAFRKNFNSSVIAYITERRMRRAKTLLSTTSLMIKEVAAECGFSSQQYFCRVFRDTYGRSPISQRRGPSADSGGSGSQSGFALSVASSGKVR